jgi:hypothetical protein
MTTTWWEYPAPKTKFAPSFKVPLYIAKDGSQKFIKDLTNYILRIEKEIIEKEELVSAVPKSGMDPYRHTQQWKQHNLLDDIAGAGGEHLSRFPKDPVIEELFTLLRTNYLTHIANLHYPRPKIYIHAWANVLRDGEWISKHTHSTHSQTYLSATYYLTTNQTSLYLENPSNSVTAKYADSGEVVEIKTEARKIIFFPSWIPHWSDKIDGDGVRISIAADIVTEETLIGNPWRPHRLFDDPKTMPGLDGKIA